MPIILDPTTPPDPAGDSVPVSDLIRKVRRKMRDWPDEDALTAPMTDSTATVTVAASSLYYVNEPIEVGYETMLVRALPSGTTLTVKRAALGSTAVAHASTDTILRKPRFPSVQIIDALSDGVQAAFPYVYKRVKDTSLSAVVDDIYEYAVPTMPGDSGQVIPFIHAVETKQSGDLTYYPVRAWKVERGSSGSKIKFVLAPPVGTSIRVSGSGPFPRLTLTTDALDGEWPRNLEHALVEYACSCLLASGEYGRVANDRGVTDDSEQANKVGASMAASQYSYQLFLSRVRNSGYPPMPRHRVAAI